MSLTEIRGTRLIQFVCLEEEPDDVSQSPTPSRSFVKPANTKKAVNEEGVLDQTVSLF